MIEAPKRATPSTPAPAATPPTAVLTAPAQVPQGQDFTLDGARSSDPDGRITRYTWRHTQGTGGSLAPGSTATTSASAPNFIVLQSNGRHLAAGLHRFSLVVTDDASNVSQPSEVQVIVADEIAPTAVLEAPAQVPQGQSFALGGARSTDQGGRIVRYTWTHSQGAGGSLATNQPAVTTANSLTVQQPNGQHLTPGQHRFRLVVTDDAGNASQPAEAQVAVIAVDTTAPTAVLDAPQRLPAGSPLTLSGARSADAAPGRIVRYRWTHLEGAGGAPLNQPVETTAPTLAQPLAGQQPLAVGRHRYRLVVTDDAGNASQPADVQVIVADEIAPTAVLEAPAQVPQGQSFALGGARSTDQGGRIVRYTWTHSQGAGGSLAANQPAVTTANSLTVQQPNGQHLTPGQHRFSLVVTDDAGNASQPAEVQVAVIAVDTTAPTAVLDGPPAIAEGDALKLDASRSREPDKGGTIAVYRWTHVSGSGSAMPAGKPVESKASSFEVPQDAKRPLQPGRHVFELTVVDAAGNESKPARATVTVTAATPPPAQTPAKAAPALPGKLPAPGKPPAAAKP